MSWTWASENKHAINYNYVLFITVNQLGMILLLAYHINHYCIYFIRQYDVHYKIRMLKRRVLGTSYSSIDMEHNLRFSSFPSCEQAEVMRVHERHPTRGIELNFQSP